MLDTIRVFIHNGMWCTGYEPYDMPGAWARVQYKLQSTEGLGQPKDGRYTGIVVGKDILRIIHGGEWAEFGVVNQSYYEYKIEFDEVYHDEYKAGLERGYKSKRKCSCNYLSKKSWDWKCGYEHGIEAQQERKRSRQVTKEVNA